jgi:hypothetical protein
VPDAAPDAVPDAAAVADGAAVAVAVPAELLDPDEHPTTAMSAPAASAARAGRTPRMATADPVLPTDTALPTPDLYVDS